MEQRRPQAQQVPQHQGQQFQPHQQQRVPQQQQQQQRVPQYAPSRSWRPSGYHCVVVIDESCGMLQEEYKRLLQSYVVPFLSQLDTRARRLQVAAKFVLVTYPDEQSWLAGTRTITAFPSVNYSAFSKLVGSLEVWGEGLSGVLGPALSTAFSCLQTDQTISQHVLVMAGAEVSPALSPPHDKQTLNEKSWQDMIRTLWATNVDVSFVSPFRHQSYIALLREKIPDVDAWFNSIAHALLPSIRTDLACFQSVMPKKSEHIQNIRVRLRTKVFDMRALVPADITLPREMTFFHDDKRTVRERVTQWRTLPGLYQINFYPQSQARQEVFQALGQFSSPCFYGKPYVFEMYKTKPVDGNFMCVASRPRPTDYMAKVITQRMKQASTSQRQRARQTGRHMPRHLLAQQHTSTYQQQQQQQPQQQQLQMPQQQQQQQQQQVPFAPAQLQQPAPHSQRTRHIPQPRAVGTSMPQQQQPMVSHPTDILPGQMPQQPQQHHHYQQQQQQQQQPSPLPPPPSGTAFDIEQLMSSCEDFLANPPH